MTTLKSCKALFDALKASALKGLLIPGSVKGLRMMAETYGSKTVVYLSPESVEVSRKWAQELQEKGFKVLKDSYVTAAEGGRWNPNTGRYDGPTKLVPRLEVQVSYFRGHGWDE